MSSGKSKLLRQLKKILPGEIVLDSQTLAKYAGDKWFATHQPDAVALGTEDFLRAFRRSNVGGEFVAWMGRCAIPFLSSNAVIREKMKGMNTVHRGSIHLLLPADETVGWEDELTVVSSGAKPASVTAVLTSSEPDQKLTADVK